MYKTKVDIPIKSGVIFAGATLEREGEDYVARHIHTRTIIAAWGADVVESHPELFEKVEEKSLAEKVLDEYVGEDNDGVLYNRNIVLLAMQEYHRLAGGWSDEDVADIVSHFSGLTNEEAMGWLKVDKQQRGRK